MAYRPAVALIDKLLPSEYKSRKRSLAARRPPLFWPNVRQNEQIEKVDIDPDTIWTCDDCHKYLTLDHAIHWEMRKVPLMIDCRAATEPPPRIPAKDEQQAYIWIARCRTCWEHVSNKG